MDNNDYEKAEGLLELFDFEDIIAVNGLDLIDVLAILISLDYVDIYDTPEIDDED